MSGPKVVRVVTREEVISTCRGSLRRLDAALAEWTRLGTRTGIMGDVEIAASRRRRDAIAALLEADRFLDLQKQADQEIAFLQNDSNRILAQAAAEAAEQRSKKRRQRDGVQVLLKALESSGKEIPSELRRSLRDENNGAAVSAAWLLLSSGEATSGAGAEEGKASDLAAFYGEGLKRQSFSDWSASQQPDETETAIRSLTLKIAELGVLMPGKEADFESRLAAVEKVDSASRNSHRDLLIDSLNLDLGRAIAAARSYRKLFVELSLLLAELHGLDAVAADEFGGQAQLASIENLPALMAKAKSALDSARARQSALMRRTVLLQSLASMGYEVNEGMATAWVKDGRVVVRSATRPDYGVEVSGDMSGERTQMRAVLFADQAAPHNANRDRDAETIWCSEVSTIKADLQKAGGDFQIERALPIGATPLKRVADPIGDERHRSGEVIEKQTRSLP